MVISLIAQRFSRAATVSIAAHPAFNSAFVLATRRTFSVNPRYLAPPETESTKTKTATKKARAESTPKKSAAKESDKAKSKKAKPGPVPAHLKPPKGPRNPYMLFWLSYLKSLELKGTTDCQEAAKNAAQIWRGMSPNEKQPFYDEYEVVKAQAQKQREEYLRNIDPLQLKRLNKIRVSQGKRRMVAKNPHPKVTPPFFRFIEDFRANPESQALIDTMAHAKTVAARVSAAAGVRWRAMSEEEKKPYFEEFLKEKKARTAS